MQGIQIVQDKLRDDLGEKGIIIECNPSSNVLIGTFQEYPKHPVFRLHQMESGQQTEEVQVCINTDDLGVFDTSLGFEYTLLFQSLRECKRPDGSRAFREEEILNYLEHLRRIGGWATFPRLDT